MEPVQKTKTVLDKPGGIMSAVKTRSKMREEITITSEIEQPNFFECLPSVSQVETSRREQQMESDTIPSTYSHDTEHSRQEIIESDLCNVGHQTEGETTSKLGKKRSVRSRYTTNSVLSSAALIRLKELELQQYEAETRRKREEALIVVESEERELRRKREETLFALEIAERETRQKSQEATIRAEAKELEAKRIREDAENSSRLREKENSDVKKREEQDKLNKSRAEESLRNFEWEKEKVLLDKERTERQAELEKFRIEKESEIEIARMQVQLESLRVTRVSGDQSQLINPESEKITEVPKHKSTERAKSKFEKFIDESQVESERDKNGFVPLCDRSYSDEKEVRITPRNILPIQGPDDDLDTFLTTFERLAFLYRWSRDKWVTYLLPVLNARGQSVHARMKMEECRDYDSFKRALSYCFDENPESYRRKFRTAERVYKETFKEYSTRIQHYFDKWLASTPGKDTDREDPLYQTILLEQFFQQIPRELRIMIKERNPSSITEASSYADIVDSCRENQFTKETARKSEQKLYSAYRKPLWHVQKFSQNKQTNQELNRDNERRNNSYGGSSNFRISNQYSQPYFKRYNASSSNRQRYQTPISYRNHRYNNSTNFGNNRYHYNNNLNNSGDNQRFSKSSPQSPNNSFSNTNKTLFVQDSKYQYDREINRVWVL